MTEFRSTDRAVFQKQVARAVPLLFEEDGALEPVIERLREAGYPVSILPPSTSHAGNPTPAHPAGAEGVISPPRPGGLRGVSGDTGGLRGVEWPGILFEVVRRGPLSIPSPAARRVAILLYELSETAAIPPAIVSADGVLCADSRTARRLKQRGVKANVLSFANAAELVAKLAPRYDLSPGADLRSREARKSGEAPSFSIIVAGTPGDLLERVLESAWRQIYPGPVEIAVVDTGSTPLKPAVPLHDPAAPEAPVKSPGAQQTPLNPPASGGKPTPSPLAGRARVGSPVASACEHDAVRCTAIPGAGLAAARNHALDLACGEYVVVLTGAVSPWSLLNCARALQQIGRPAAVFVPAGPPAGTGAEACATPPSPSVLRPTSSVLRPSSPVPYGVPELDFSGGAWSGPGAIAFHRSVVEGGIRYDETAPDGILDQEFRCRLDDRGCRVAELPPLSGQPVPWPDEPFDLERVSEEEAAFFERHPHARLRGSRALALEPVDGGVVDVLIDASISDDEQIRLSRLSMERQGYVGKIKIIVCEDETRSRFASTGLEGTFVLIVAAGTLLAPRHIQNCVNLLRYQGANCICGSAAASIPALESSEILTLLARWPQVQPIPASGMPYGVPAPDGALFMSRRMYERTRSELAKPAGSTREDEERALQDAGGRMIDVNRLPVWRAGSA